jgi:hypothetical protein
MQGQKSAGTKRIYILLQSCCVANEVVLVSRIRPRMGVLPERSGAVKQRIVSTPPPRGAELYLFFDFFMFYLQPAGRGPIWLAQLAIQSRFVNPKSVLSFVHVDHQFALI